MKDVLYELPQALAVYAFCPGRTIVWLLVTSVRGVCAQFLAPISAPKQDTSEQMTALLHLMDAPDILGQEFSPLGLGVSRNDGSIS